jgi:hypothetical protein
MIAEVLLIKGENRYLLEHLAYNAAAGVEHFFIYDNLSDTPVADFLRENARDCLSEKDRHKMAEFFEANPTISQTAPEVVSLMQKHGVNLGAVQKYFDVYPSN